MRRRGRPPHPDILTPRQWEVLDLLRQGLPDQTIADRLGLTLAGAKYHVSEILTKLNVSSREEAARWQPETAAAGPSWWSRALGLTFAAKATGVVLACTAVAGLTVLAAGVATSGPGDDPQTSTAIFDAPDLPSPVHSPAMTREQAIVYAATERIIPFGIDLRGLDIQATTRRHAETGTSAFDPDDIAWFVRIRYVGDGQPYEALGGEPGSPAYVITCRERVGHFTENETGLGYSSGVPTDDCDFAPTSDIAVVLAAQEMTATLFPVPTQHVTVEEITWGEAKQLSELPDTGALIFSNYDPGARYGSSSSADAPATSIRAPHHPTRRRRHHPAAHPRPPAAWPSPSSPLRVRCCTPTPSSATYVTDRIVQRRHPHLSSPTA